MGLDNSIFEKEKVGRLLLKFSVPAIISLLVAELYNMVDTLYVGRAIGASGIGALIIAFPIQRMVVAVSMLIAIGTSTFVARGLGEKDNEGIKKAVSNSISLVIATILPLVIIIFSFKSSIIKGLGASDAIFPYAEDYITIVLIGAIFQGFTFVGNYIMMALGDSRITLVSTSIGAICNIIIDYILVIAIPLGVKGAAIATVISQVIAFIFTLKHFLKVKSFYNLSFKLNLQKSICMQIISVGFTTFIIEGEDGAVVAFLTNLLASHGGDSAITTLGIITKVSFFMYITVIGISSSMQPIAAYNYGAGNYKKLREVVKKTIIAVSITSIIAWVPALVFSEQMIGIFIKDYNIIKESAKAFRIMMAAYPLLSIYYVSLYYNQAIGRAKHAFLLSIGKQILMVIPLSFIFIKVFNMGPMGVWISYPIGDTTVSIASALLLKKWNVKMDRKIKRAALVESELA